MTADTNGTVEGDVVSAHVKIGNTPPKIKIDKNNEPIATDPVGDANSLRRAHCKHLEHPLDDVHLANYDAKNPPILSESDADHSPAKELHLSVAKPEPELADTLETSDSDALSLGDKITESLVPATNKKGETAPTLDKK